MVKAQALFSRKWVGEAPIQHLAQRSAAPIFQLGQFDAVVLTDSNFAQVQAAPKAVVDFWVPTCPPCVTYKPVFEDVAASVPGILMATANINDAPIAAGQYSIAATPTTIFFINGKEVHRVEGGMSKPGLQAEIAKAFSGTPVSTSMTVSPLSIVLGAVALAGLGVGIHYFVTRKK